MSEESQLEEMRSAIRGDFERLARRRGEQELMRIDEDIPPEEPSPVLEGDEQREEPSPRSWLARLLAP